jgi:hypothetical protein
MPTARLLSTCCWLLLLLALAVVPSQVWHLQPGSSRLPTAQQFHATLGALPRTPCELLLLLGEIDCREGLVAAVQKGKVCVSWLGG